ncbi:Protein ltv1 [Coemansia sp. RSA 1813]|nr:Protein ltv1 [Coemansia sp. RSA 1646]KAJ1772849.1 Protein ltv1 [Coemansia sp. RSA 1843]KAJ2088887.1 Protein ltv1 [Coemansia sp. RSA 986]KAJ2213962.1 Protein ltv1 [Coemansia sp. RSA 487]KAJ2568730.1 Protein ltv1 [Coemansia sp. RSA 1813]
MVKKFIDKKSSKTYQLVYRSQEDPLAFEEGTTERVFVPAQRGAITTGSKGKEVDQTIQRGFEGLHLDRIDEDVLDGGAGRAALYGVYLDDRDYDYTKHLRQVGTGGVILEAPTKKENRPSGIEILDREEDDCDSSGSQKESTIAHTTRKGELPAEALPSTHRMDIKSEAMPSGLQPHMDPNLRDVLEALEDDDVDEFGDDFLDKLNADELSSGDEDALGDEDDEDFDPNDVFAAVQRMKARNVQKYDSDDDYDEDEGHGGWPRTTRTASTGASMSSSAMFRNDKLTLLDEQFDKIEAMYEEDNDDSEDERYDSEGNYIAEYDSDGNAKPISTRPDFESVLNEFLDDYELTGKRMQVKVEGTTGAGKLNTFRSAMLDESMTEEESRKKLLETGKRQIEESNAKTKEMEEAELDELFKEKKRTPWDCQTILTTYSNLDNHPAMIYEQRKPQIRVSRKSGFPVVASKDNEQDKADDSNDDEAEEIEKENKGKARQKGETAEEKRERKKKIQEAKRDRREQKKDNREIHAEKRDRKMQSKKDRAQLVLHMD